MNPKIRIEMLPAENGDCFLLHLGDIVWLIDSGYKQTYREFLKSRLQEIAAKGGQLDRMIITHIDRDHISGAVQFLEENGPADRPNIIPVGQIWHNSYRHIQFADKVKGELTAEQRKLLRTRIRRNHLSDDFENEGNLVSAKQGSTLAGRIYQGGYAWNADFDGRAVATEGPLLLDAGHGIRLFLLSPNGTGLEKLGKVWRQEFRLYGRVEPLNEDTFYDDAMEYLMAEDRSPGIEGGLVSASKKWIEKIIKRRDEYKEDRSAANRSSISFLLEYGEKKLLFLGDIIPSLIMDRLKQAFPNISKENPLKVDVLKLSHHGGFTNNSPDLLELVVADHYLISTNGRIYNHPHPETLAWVISLHQNVHKRLHFNYHPALEEPSDNNGSPNKMNDLLHKDIMQQYNYSVSLPEVDGCQILEFG